ncbi:MBL fold metallo-hydrolase [Actinopolyspora xinjiangensis]|uniref:MBL fold metallo-hydrolase n=1 Tax=Actinopolyspora xinjiangensis TaxID=405564 RepID=UPI00244EDD3D|nr:MBL fold metallo-hydrolase [Actinopolyspora xinjiangensis]
MVRTREGNLLWDPPNHLDRALLDRSEELGGITVVVASHPHMYGTQVGLSHLFDQPPVLVHAADERWVRRPDPVIRQWRDTERVLPGVTLVETGGHFPGSAVAHVADGGEGTGSLLVGDTVMPVAATGRVTFMRSYPNQIPLSARLVRRIVERLEPYEFERLHALTGRTMHGDAKNAVRRSAARYVEWVNGAYDHLG